MKPQEDALLSVPEERKVYEKPRLVYELEIETRAGSPWGDSPWEFGPYGPTGPWTAPK